MAFVRTVKRENPFVQLDKYFLEDENLQWESKGLLGYILSRPDNWQINQSDLVKRSAGGKGKVESALLDLMANGYVDWYMVRNEDGTINGWFYDVYERPEFNPNKDECIAKGKKRIEEKKVRNKRKNDKKKEPESDNPELDPESDNPFSAKPISDNPPYNNNDFKDIDFNNIEEEEEPITLSAVLAFLNEQIKKREITNQKTITAIYEVADKCRAIGTTNIESMGNYCIKVVEEKMALIGQKQKAAKQTKKEQITPAAEEKELTKEEWLTQAVKQRETKGDVDKMSEKEKEVYFKQGEELKRKLEKLG